MASTTASIKNDIYHMYLSPEGIVCLEPVFEDDQLDVTIELVDELLANTLKLTNNQPYMLLFDYQNKYMNLPKEVVDYVYKDPKFSELKIAEAIVTNSLPNRLAMNFYLAVMKPPRPAKLFKTKEKAIKWLLGHREKHNTL